MLRFTKIFTYTIALLVFTFPLSCGIVESTENEKIEYEDISETCLKRLQMGGIENIVINTQEKYDSLLSEKYEKRTTDYFQTLLDYVKDYYPDLNEVQQKELADSLLLSDPFYTWITDCSFNEIDFQNETLIGVFTETILPDEIEYVINFSRNTSSCQYILNINVISSGQRWSINKERSFWLLLDKIPTDYKISITTKYINE